MRAICSLGVVLFLAAFSAVADPPRSKANAATALAVAVSIDEVQDWENMRATVTSKDGRFYVGLFYEPSTPGRVLLVVVRSDGTIERVARGL